MIKLMLITNNVELSKHAVRQGVARIFVDLEINGKQARQGHLDTLISRHHMSDVALIRNAIPNHELLVRLNPFYSGSFSEINDAISLGADILMLPMFTNANDVNEFARMIDGRAQFMPLIETVGAANAIEEVAVIKGVTELYIGLNDLHLELKNKFMFEPLGSGLVEKMAAVIKLNNLPFGFGGIARIGEGFLPAEKVLGEHMRLGSSSVILSRTFNYRATSVEEIEQNTSLQYEIQKIFDVIKALSQRDSEQIKKDKMEVQNIINQIAKI